MLTDAQTPFLGSPLVLLKSLSRRTDTWHDRLVSQQRPFEDARGTTCIVVFCGHRRSSYIALSQLIVNPC